MKKTTNKGFTIVELVIVIAVVAILAAVLIPTFISLVKTAQTSADVSLVKNINLILATDRATEGKNATMQDALNDVLDGGYDVTKLSPTNSDNLILWDQESDNFVLYANEKYNNCGAEVNVDPSALYKLWNITNTTEGSKYSVYYTGIATEVTVDGVGFDAGNSDVAVVNYESDTAKNVIIRTNGGQLNVDDQGTNGTVSHYGFANSANVKTDNECFYTCGTINELNVAAGTVIAEKGSAVYVASAASGTTVKKENGGIVIAFEDAVIEGATVEVSPSDERIKAISNYEELLAFAEAVNSGANVSGVTYRLTADIEVDAPWVSIGTEKFKFTGSFDGNGHKISGLDKPFMGYVTGNVQITDLTLDVAIDMGDTEFVGGLFRVYDIKDMSGVTAKVLIDSVTVNGSVVAMKKAGGLIGSSYKDNSGTNNNIEFVIKNCTNNASVTAERDGGIIGTVSGAFADGKGYTAFKIVFENCVNNGTITGKAGSAYKAGGIVGFLCTPGNYTFTNCSSVEVADGGKLFGRIHDAGAYGWTNPENAKASGMNYIYGCWDTYISSTHYIQVVIDGGAQTYFYYTSGTPLASNEWRLTIDGKHYKCDYNVPINSADDCTETTGAHIGNPTLAEIESVWTNPEYVIDKIEGGRVYLVPKN